MPYPRKTPVQIPAESYWRRSGKYTITFALLDYWNNPRNYKHLTNATWQLTKAMNAGIDVLEEHAGRNRP